MPKTDAASKVYTCLNKDAVFVAPHFLTCTSYWHRTPAVLLRRKTDLPCNPRLPDLDSTNHSVCTLGTLCCEHCRQLSIWAAPRFLCESGRFAINSTRSLIEPPPSRQDPTAQHAVFLIQLLSRPFRAGPSWQEQPFVSIAYRSALQPQTLLTTFGTPSSLSALVITADLR
jgi:hypothetical protein